jgi:tetratricopeptide (TPR) repeat protein
MPRVISQVSIMSQSDVIDGILVGEIASRQSIDAAQQAYDRALQWQPNNIDYLTVRGRLAMRLAELPDVSSLDQIEFYKSAASYFNRSVVAAPDYQYGWCLLVYAEQRSGVSPERVARKLAYAYLRGPYETSCMALRGVSGIAVWNFLSTSTQDAVRRDLGNMWSTPSLRPYLANIYINLDARGRSIVRAAALTSPQEMRSFDRKILRTLGLDYPKKK